jgi:hypothetical protein
MAVEIRGNMVKYLNISQKSNETMNLFVLLFEPESPCYWDLGLAQATEVKRHMRLSQKNLHGNSTPPTK